MSDLAWAFERDDDDDDDNDDEQKQEGCAALERALTERIAKSTKAALLQELKTTPTITDAAPSAGSSRNATTDHASPDPDARACIVQLANLPADSERSRIYELARPFGKIVAIELRRNDRTGAHSGTVTAAVTFATAGDAEAAAAGLKGAYAGAGLYMTASIGARPWVQTTDRRDADGTRAEHHVGRPFGAKPRKVDFRRMAPPTAFTREVDLQRGSEDSVGGAGASRSGPQLQVIVRRPRSRRVLLRIHRCVQAVLLHGPAFELCLRRSVLVLHDARFAFLYQHDSEAGVYYRYCLWRAWQCRHPPFLAPQQQQQQQSCEVFDDGIQWLTQAGAYGEGSDSDEEDSAQRRRDLHSGGPTLFESARSGGLRIEDKLVHFAQVQQLRQALSADAVAEEAHRDDIVARVMNMARRDAALPANTLCGALALHDAEANAAIALSSWQTMIGRLWCIDAVLMSATGHDSRHVCRLPDSRRRSLLEHVKSRLPAAVERLHRFQQALERANTRRATHFQNLVVDKLRAWRIAAVLATDVELQSLLARLGVDFAPDDSAEAGTVAQPEAGSSTARRRGDDIDGVHIDIVNWYITHGLLSKAYAKGGKKHNALPLHYRCDAASRPDPTTQIVLPQRQAQRELGGDNELPAQKRQHTAVDVAMPGRPTPDGSADRLPAVPTKIAFKIGFGQSKQSPSAARPDLHDDQESAIERHADTMPHVGDRESAGRPASSDRDQDPVSNSSTTQVGRKRGRMSAADFM